MSALGTLRRWGPRGTWTAMELTGLALLIELGLRWAKLQTVARRCGVPLDLNAPSAPAGTLTDLVLSAQEAQDLQVMRALLRRRPFNGTCLRRALLCGWILRVRHPILVVGVRKTGRQVAAHAWIQVGGLRIDPDPVGGFVALQRPVS